VRAEIPIGDLGILIFTVKGWETACKREKKAFFITRMMNSNSLSWASYCSSASDFLPIEESGAACFAELLLKFCCFQPNIEADFIKLNRNFILFVNSV
jgi:hypothetical protein